MSTQAQAQHCKEYMQPVHINTQATSVLLKHIVEQIRKKQRASEEGGLGVNRQKISQERFHGMSYRSRSSIILRAGCYIVLLALYNCYLLLIALIVKQFAKEPSRTAFDISRRPYFRPRTGFGRREHLFGVGWFLEWPGGQRPLNSTWPWSGVKLSILVLWAIAIRRHLCARLPDPHRLICLQQRRIICHPVSSVDFLTLFKEKAKDDSWLLGATLPSQGSRQVREDNNIDNFEATPTNTIPSPTVPV
ncbi:hypothetical protein EAF00_009646 [Botryotinia globosa]|nr:hypothetical protein EAF00_009646 [Botryotinia globosa]